MSVVYFVLYFLYCCVLVVDHYSKWVTALPIRNKKLVTTVNALKNHVFHMLPKIPTNMLSHNGPEIVSCEFERLLCEFDVMHNLM